MIIFNDGAIADLLGALRTRINGYVAQVNAELGLLLEDVDIDNAILDHVPPVQEITRWPTIGIGEGPTTLADDIGWSATGHHLLTVMLFHQHADVGELARQLRGYRIAAANAALEGRQLGSQWGVVLRGTVPGPTLGEGDSPRAWISMTGIALELRDDQNAW